ncbi:HAD family hydrolase [Nocardia pneumoniae]|uniref:HAD family hydrolase n=1 Tax=Nocardia pneumoniae TaxID=228601 RepID=UPI00059402D4|nr:haloacid dehalogenase-like hydrolase [Nocardia pneumoniae]
MSAEYAGLIVWDVDGTLIPADLRWLRRAVARTYAIQEADVIFPSARVHGYTDESIVVDTAISSGISPELAELGIERFPRELAQVMTEGEQEFVRDQPPYPGTADAISSLDEYGFVQTVLTGNLRAAAEFKLRVAGLDSHLDLDIGGFGSDARDRFELPAVVAKQFAARYGDALDAARTVVIGDAPNDIACARHAGFRVIAVAHRIGRDELAQHSPDAILDDRESNSVLPTVQSLIGRS